MGSNSETIKNLQSAIDRRRTRMARDETTVILLSAASSLLQCHDETGIDLQQWPEVRDFVEMITNQAVVPQDQSDPEDDHMSFEPGRCPACGEYVDSCIGHGELGDPIGYRLLQRHDKGLHDECSQYADCRVNEDALQALRDKLAGEWK